MWAFLPSVRELPQKLKKVDLMGCHVSLHDNPFVEFS